MPDIQHDHALNTHEAAIVAAAQATEATAELLRFAREGEINDRNAFDAEVDVVAKLAEALKLALEIEDHPRADTYLDADELALLNNLKAATAAFIAGWNG